MRYASMARQVRSALSGQPEARLRRRVLVSAGWWLTEQTGEGNVTSVAVCYKNPRSNGTGNGAAAMVSSCLPILRSVFGAEFLVEDHAGDFAVGCPTHLLGRHIHIMDK